MARAPPLPLAPGLGQGATGAYGHRGIAPHPAGRHTATQPSRHAAASHATAHSRAQVGRRAGALRGAGRRPARHACLRGAVASAAPRGPEPEPEPDEGGADRCEPLPWAALRPRAQATHVHVLHVRRLDAGLDGGGRLDGAHQLRRPAQVPRGLERGYEARLGLGRHGRRPVAGIIGSVVTPLPLGVYGPIVLSLNVRLRRGYRGSLRVRNYMRKDR